MPNESLFRSALRSMLKAIFTIVGISLGLLPAIAIFNSVEDESFQLKSEMEIEVYPNANGVRKALDDLSPVVLVINIEGVIGVEELSANHIRQALMESRENKLKGRVKAILLRINTPGGTVFDAEGIYEALTQYKEDYSVPIFAFADGLCASGGVYVAACADKVYASEVSVVGSVGVVLSSFVNVSELLKNWGIQSKTIHAGKGKDALNPLRPWEDGEDRPLQQLTEQMYERFVNIVTEARPNLNRNLLVSEYGANVFLARDAQEKGFVDVAGSTYRSCLKDLLQAADIHGSYRVVGLKPKNWLADFFGKTPQLVPEFLRPVDPKLQNQFLYLYPGLS